MNISGFFSVTNANHYLQNIYLTFDGAVLNGFNYKLDFNISNSDASTVTIVIGIIKTS